MNKPIHLGLIGCGGIVQKTHARAYHSLTETVKISALADIVSEWRASKSKGGGCISDTSYHEIYSVCTLIQSQEWTVLYSDAYKAKLRSIQLKNKSGKFCGDVRCG